MKTPEPFSLGGPSIHQDYVSPDAKTPLSCISVQSRDLGIRGPRKTLRGLVTRVTEGLELGLGPWALGLTSGGRGLELALKGSIARTIDRDAARGSGS